ncbi:UPF1 [Symbiodinium sp. CCMP2592]|nr:UPF1 [Symbiodinium sp. CCMP2592]
MVAWRELCKGVLVEALRFVVAAWGESKHPVSCKENGQEATWICSDQRDYWEAQARKCRDRLAEAELSILELEAYRRQRFWIELVLWFLSILLSFLLGGFLSATISSWHRGVTPGHSGQGLALEAPQWVAESETLASVPKDGKELADTILEVGQVYQDIRRVHNGRLPQGVDENETYMAKHSDQGAFTRQELLELIKKAEADDTRRPRHRITGKLDSDGQRHPVRATGMEAAVHEREVSDFVWIVVYSSDGENVGDQVTCPASSPLLQVGGLDYKLFVSGGRTLLARKVAAEVAPEVSSALRPRAGDVQAAERDVRVLPVMFDASDERWRTLTEAFPEYEEIEYDDFPLTGPRTVYRDIRQLRRLGFDFVQHHESWVRKSGVRGTDRSVHEHSSICRALNFMASYDQLNLPSLASAEALNRRRALIEVAHQGRPDAPSYEGSDEILGVREATDGSVIDPALTQHAAKRQAARAEILKQNRLAAEERKHLRQRPDGPPNPPNKPDKKGKGEGKGGQGGLAMFSPYPYLLTMVLPGVKVVWLRVAQDRGFFRCKHMAVVAFECGAAAHQFADQAALRQLLRKKAGTYSSDQPGQLASYARERLSLPRGQGEPVRLTDILPPRERHQLENFADEMMLGDEEIAGVLERGLDGLRHIDPVLAHNPRRYHEFVADLYDCKLVGFTVTPRVQVGAFVVTKKGDRQRLIVDARRTNRLFRTPPSTNLGSIESWARLECSQGETLFMAQEDVKDFFYRLRIDQKLGEYFALPMVDPLLLQECLGYMPEELQALADRHEGPYYPFLTVLPMGFSWAFHLAHQAHMEVARRVLPDSLLVKDRRPAVRMGRADGECQTAMLIYADNNNHLGVDLGQVDRDQERVMEELHRHGLATHDIVHGCSLCESLGVRVDGLNGKVETTPKRDWRLDRALLACCAAPCLSGAELEVLVGHMTVRALLHRGLMSILRHSYVFIRSNYHRRTRLWDSVIHELELFRNLMVLGQADIFSRWDASPLITDACTSGYGVCEGQWNVTEVEAVGREDERWRYHRGPPDRENPRAAALNTTDVFDDPCSVLPDFEGELPFQLVENPMFPEVPKSLLSPEKWHTLWCAPFDYKDTIHVLEARGVLGAVKHRSRDQMKHGTRVLILNDNLGVVLSISKGRCADYGLLRILRRIAAHSLATGIRFIVRWVPSELNIADGPSRTWESPHEQYRKCEARRKEGCRNFHEGGGHESQCQIE